MSQSKSGLKYGILAVVAAGVCFCAFAGFQLWRANGAHATALTAAEKSQKELGDMQKLYLERADYLTKWASSFSSLGIKSDRITLLKSEVQASRGLSLKTQDDFDSFDIKQNVISNEFAEFIEFANKNLPEASRKAFNTSLMQFERLELSLARKRAAYHEVAFEERRLASIANRSSGLMFKPVSLQPVFKAEAMLHEQKL